MKELVLDFIRKGDTGAAIQALVSGLSANSAQAGAALKAVRLIEAEYNRLREDQLQNIVDPDSAEARTNAINKRILDLLDLLEAPARPKSKSRRLLLLLAAAGLLGVGLAWILFRKPGPVPPPVTPAQPGFDCPSFSPEQQLRIAILPFLNLTQGEDMPLHIGLQDELNALMRRLGYPGSAKVAHEDPNKNYLTFEDAEALLDSCGPDLVVWGKYSTSGNNGDAFVDVRYVSLPVAHTQQEDVDSLLEHRDQAELSANLKTMAKLLLAQAFLVENRADLAIGLAQQVTELERYPPTDSIKGVTPPPSSKSDAHVILAEAYQMLDQPEKAAESYEEALRIQPDNKTALTNKAILDFKANRLKEAEKQADKALEINPEGLNLHLLKVKIYEEQGEAEKAKAARRVFQIEKKAKETIDSLKVVTPMRKANH
jgi:tetratricopeptide (TPR) repeat protein